mmetsp:Transcript_5027/g.12770  ORF Transcript_5027/g.12770 Transcript_5027/m.12770 type:complete len:162 (+) Transcript_5027:344-829(+)
MPTQFGTKEDAKDPGPWPHKILEIGMVASKKKLCCLCELWFSVENLTGIASWKAVLQKKASFGDEHAAAKLADRRTSASRLYSGVPLCCFCTQLLAPDPDLPGGLMLEDSVKSPLKSVVGSPGGSKVPPSAASSSHSLGSGTGLTLKPSTFLASFRDKNKA